MIDYTAILTRRYNAEWFIDGENYEGLTWLSDSPKPSKKELDDLWDSVKTEIENEIECKSAAKAALLDKLGITAEEARLLLS